MDTSKSLKFRTVAQLAAAFGADKATFWDCFTLQHKVDMLQLGWTPHKYLLTPPVVKYVNEVVMERKPRKEVFPDLMDLKSPE